MSETNLATLEAKFYKIIEAIIVQMRKEQINADFLNEMILEYLEDWEIFMHDNTIEARAHFAFFMFLFFDHPVFFNNIRKYESIDSLCQELIKCYKELSKEYKKACGVSYG